MCRMDITGALKLMDEITERAGNFEMPFWVSIPISAFKVFFWLAKGDLNAALKWAQDRGLRIDFCTIADSVCEYLVLLDCDRIVSH